MQVIKLYGWEPFLEGQIADIREKEMVLLRKAAKLNSSFIFCFTCAPFLVRVDLTVFLFWQNEVFEFPCFNR